jgi:hypothetical protein
MSKSPNAIFLNSSLPAAMSRTGKSAPQQLGKTIANDTLTQVLLPPSGTVGAG